MHFLAVYCLSVSSRLHWVFDFRIHKREYLCGRVKYFATVHLFIIKINSVLEEIIR